MQIIYIYVILLGIVFKEVIGECIDESWTESSTGRCFKAFDFLSLSTRNDDTDQWKVADRYCWDLPQPTRLATIYNDEENAIVQQLSEPLGGQCWIGLRKYRIISTQGWWWVDGDYPLTKDSYTQYDPAISKLWLYLPPYEKCGIMTKSGWNIKNCNIWYDNAKCFVCSTSKSGRNPDDELPVGPLLPSETFPVDDNTGVIGDDQNVDPIPNDNDNSGVIIPDPNVSSSSSSSTTTSSSSSSSSTTSSSTSTSTKSAIDDTTSSSTVYDSNEVWDSCLIFGICDPSYPPDVVVNNDTTSTSTVVTSDSSSTIDSTSTGSKNIKTEIDEIANIDNSGTVAIEYVILIIIAGILVLVALTLFLCCKRRKRIDEDKNPYDVETAKSPTRSIIHSQITKPTFNHSIPISEDYKNNFNSTRTVIPPGTVGRCAGEIDDNVTDIYPIK